MKLPGNLTVAIITAGALLACPLGAFAQSAPDSKTIADKARTDELLKYARAAYEDGKDQATPQQRSLEERAQARPIVQLTQDEAVRRALASNIDLTVARMNPQLQDLSLESLYAAYLPTASSTLNATGSKQIPSSILDGAKSDSITNSGNVWNFGVSQPLKWYGGTVALNFNNGKTASNNTNATLNPQFTSNVSVTYTQPLWRNFKIDNTRMSIKTGKIARELADVSLRSIVVNAQANTQNAYWNLSYAIQALEAAKVSLGLAERLVQDNQVRVEVGTLAPMDVISAQAEAASRRQTLTAAEATRRTAEIALKRLIVTGTDDPIWNSTIEPTDKVSVQRTLVNLEEAVKLALAQRTDLVTARRNLDSSDVNIGYLRNQINPQLDLSATYRTSGQGGTATAKASSASPGNWDYALTTLSKFKFPNWSVQLSFSYPIGNSTADVALARAKVTYKQAQTQLRATELQVATDVTNAALNVESTLRRLEASTASRQLSEKRLEAEQSKFEVGMSYNYLVVQAQRDLNDARNSELRATLDYQIALTTFARVQITP